MREMTISHFAENNRTIIHYIEDNEPRIREEYKGISIKTAERKFREKHSLKGVKIEKRIHEH